MHSSLLLRIASIIALLFAVGHSIGAPWTPVSEAAPASVVEAMKSVSFDAMGSTRTYWDFYFGFGISISIYLLAQAAILWLVASLARAHADAARPFVVVLLVAYAANIYVTFKYFFVIPLVMSIAVVTCLALALIARRPRASA